MLLGVEIFLLQINATLDKLSWAVMEWMGGPTTPNAKGGSSICGVEMGRPKRPKRQFVLLPFLF